MSASPQGRSNGFITSPRPGPSPGQFPFPQNDYSPKPGVRGSHGRKVSTAGSLASLGAALEPASTAVTSIPESGHNGKKSDEFARPGTDLSTFQLSPPCLCPH